MAIQAGWRIDVNQCISCRACEMACKVEYGLQAGQGRRRRVVERCRDEAGTVRTYFVSVSCHHCKFPACKAACASQGTSKRLNSDGSVNAADTPSKSALFKDVEGAYTSTAVKGVVLHNPAKCVGCRKCEWACPYGAPQYNSVTKKIHKCELCWQRVTNTDLSPERRTTACAATCLGGAITFTPGTASASTDPTFAVDGTLTGTAPTSSDGGYYSAAAHGVDPDDAAGTQWSPPGDSPTATGYDEGRGSSESASYTLTYPAIRFRTRVYKDRTNGAVV